MLKQTQSQKQVQKVLPQIIQKQSLLAVPAIALEQMIKKELEENPLLEESDDDIDDSPTSDDSQSESKSEDGVETVDKELEDDQTGEDLDLGDYYNDNYDGYKTDEFKKNKENINYENMWKEQVTLKDNLISQLHVSNLSDKETFIGEYIIGNLDEDGYCRLEDDVMAGELGNLAKDTDFEGETFSKKEIDGVIKTIQKFEPLGIGSRNLQECLLVQVDELDTDVETKECIKKLIQNYFEDLRLKKFERIMKALDIDKEKLNEIFELVQKLNPKPGYNDDNLEQNYIYPDMIVTKVNGEYKVFHNDKFPMLRINNEYRAMISDRKNGISRETKDYIKNNFDRAKWYIDAINSRRETMIKVMNSILIRQYDFFENMGEGLKPMYEKDVADDIHMDISTVSRTVRGKYVQTDFGIFELKYFFSNSMVNEEGDDISTKEIKKKLKDIIDEEDSTKPYTDEQLTTEMEKAGFKIARRTVAKYREAMNIPKARLRRKI